MWRPLRARWSAFLGSGDARHLALWFGHPKLGRSKQSSLPGGCRFAVPLVQWPRRQGGTLRFVAAPAGGGPTLSLGYGDARHLVLLASARFARLAPLVGACGADYVLLPRERESLKGWSTNAFLRRRQCFFPGVPARPQGLLGRIKAAGASCTESRGLVEI